MRREWYHPMTDAERALEESRMEVEYLFSWFRSRCGTAEELCQKLNDYFIDREKRNIAARTIGGTIRDIEKQVEKLRKEWTRCLELKKKAEQSE